MENGSQNPQASPETSPAPDRLLWMAGFFDVRGSILLTKANTVFPIPRVNVSAPLESLLAPFALYFGFNIRPKLAYVFSQRAESFLKSIEPHVYIQYERLSLILKYRAIQSQGLSGYTDEQIRTLNTILNWFRSNPRPLLDPSRPFRMSPTLWPYIAGIIDAAGWVGVDSIFVTSPVEHVYTILHTAVGAERQGTKVIVVPIDVLSAISSYSLRSQGRVLPHGDTD